MKRFISLCLVMTCWFCVMDSVHAQRGLAKALTKAARISDDVPMRGADDIGQVLRNSRSAQEAVERSAKRIVRAADPDAIKNALRADLQVLDPSLVRFADELGDVERQALLVMSKGAKESQTIVPDMMKRAEFLHRGGVETLTSMGMYDDLAQSALRMDAAIQGGRVISPAGMRSATLQDFGQLFTKYGDAAHNFWTKYVVPHWDKWLIGGTGGTALAWYLIDPEGFMDTIGNLTEEGMKRLTQFAGEVAAKIISGVAEGAANAAEAVGDASTNAISKTLKTFFGSWAGFIGSIILFFAIACCFPFTRYYALKPFRILFHKPRNNE